MDRYDAVYNRHFNGSGIGKVGNGKYITYDDAMELALTQAAKTTAREMELLDEIAELKERITKQNKIINYCIGNMHNVGQLKYIESMCRKLEKAE